MSEIILYCNCSSENEASKIANLLVNERIAGCVNIIPKIKSVYRWKNEIVNDEETTLVIKTTSNNYENVESLIKKEHSYAIPEIIAVDMKNGSNEYLNWLRNECK